MNSMVGGGDDLLHIESPPMPHPNVNDKVVRVIVSWQRDKPSVPKAAR